MEKKTKAFELQQLALQSTKQLYEAYTTSSDGLTASEAKTRLESFGMNIVAAQNPIPAWKIWLNALKDPFVIVLLLLAFVSPRATPRRPRDRRRTPRRRSAATGPR